MMDRCVFAALVGDDVDFSHRQPHRKVSEKGGKGGGLGKKGNLEEEPASFGPIT